MFEQELEMEKKSSNIIPVIMLLVLAGVIIGTAAYWLVQSRKVLKPEEAATVVSGVLKTQPAILRFHTGLVKPGMNDNPRDPHYKLLEKGGYLMVGKPKGDAVPVALTAKGEKDLPAFPEFQKSKESDGSEALIVPLAQRKLVAVSKITMHGLNRAKVEYTWQWQPNELGDLFDAAGPGVKSFGLYETQRLIEKYNANFYHGSPNQASINLIRYEQGIWEVQK